jgi:hypothetical protein
VEKERQHWNPELFGVLNFDPRHALITVSPFDGVWNPAITTTNPSQQLSSSLHSLTERPPRRGPESVIYNCRREQPVTPSSHFSTQGDFATVTFLPPMLKPATHCRYPDKDKAPNRPLGVETVDAL